MALPSYCAFREVVEEKTCKICYVMVFEHVVGGHERMTITWMGVCNQAFLHISNSKPPSRPCRRSRSPLEVESGAIS